MPDPYALEEFDRDGAVSEAIEGLDQSTTRSGMLRRIGLVAGGGLIAGAVPFALANAQGGLPKGDIDILNFALTLEYLESAFYAEAVSKGNLKDSAVQSFATTVAGHEATHVSALQKVLGAKAVKKPNFDFKNTTGSQKTFLATSKVLEDTGVSAYQGQGPNIKTGAVLASAGSILAVEARHAAWVRNLIGDGKSLKPAPDAFSPAKSMSEILAAVKGTGFIKS